MDDFPSLTNFIVCSIVSLSGLYWLRDFGQKYEDDVRYIFRAYLWWWFSWLTWTITWAVITFTNWEQSYPRLILALSDLNAIFLITVYFSLTRGNKYKPIFALIDFSYLCAITAAGYGIFLALLPERFNSLQKGWGLCLSAVSTLLVGWAFVFRYKTRLVLIIGFVYAFSQPIAFDAILKGNTSSESILEAFKFVLAIFKIFWATVVTVYFTQYPITKENIVVDSGKGALLPSPKEWPIPFYIQTFVLLVTIIGLMIFIAFNKYPDTAKNQIVPVLSALSALVAIVTLLGKAFKWLRDNVKKKEAHVEGHHPVP